MMRVVWVKLWFLWVAYVGLVLVVAVAAPRPAIAATTVAGITGRGSSVLAVDHRGRELGPGVGHWWSVGYNEVMQAVQDSIVPEKCIMDC